MGGGAIGAETDQKTVAASPFLLFLRSRGESGAANGSIEPQELLRAHDAEVARHGKDLKYIEPIGRYGREGVSASMEHLRQHERAVTSYNGIELVFGVAEAARVSRGYDICQDQATLRQLDAMAQKADTPAYERSIFNDLQSSYCDGG